MAFSLLPHQAAGVEILRQQTKPFGLFDDMGLGKTFTTIATLDSVDARRVLVVCPAAVRQVWLEQFKRFARTQRVIRMAREVADLGNWLRGRVDVLLCSYEYARNNIDNFLRRAELYDALVIDEAHYAKTVDSARTKALLGDEAALGAKCWAGWAGRVYLLTGTPWANGVVDTYTLLRASGVIKDTPAQFKVRYFDAKMGKHGPRWKLKNGAQEAIKALMDQMSIRRTLADAGIALPPIWLTTTHLQGDDQQIRELLQAHPAVEQIVKDAAREGSLGDLEVPYIAQLRRLIGQAKAPPFTELLMQEFRDGLPKAVVMTWHQQAADIVLAGAREGHVEAVSITGQVASEAVRRKAIDRFQNDPKCRLFVGNIRAAGTGLTLTASDKIYMLEQSWSPADNTQALKRVHRIGQDKEVRATNIVLEGTVDELVVQNLHDKMAEILSVDGTAFS